MCFCSCHRKRTLRYRKAKMVWDHLYSELGRWCGTICQGPYTVSRTWVELPEVTEVPVQTRVVAPEYKQLSVVGN